MIYISGESNYCSKAIGSACKMTGKVGFDCLFVRSFICLFGVYQKVYIMVLWISNHVTGYVTQTLENMPSSASCSGEETQIQYFPLCCLLIYCEVYSY